MIPQPHANAVLTFRGGANGEEPPIRVIQGSLTQLGIAEPDQLAIDPVNNEIFVPQGEAILVFPREATGNVAPTRVLNVANAPSSAYAVAVDPVHNLLLVTGRSRTIAGTGDVMIFDRMAKGDAKPQGVISGPKTHLGGNTRIFAHPPRRRIIVIQGGNVRDAAAAAFVSTWNIDDKGDVAPRRWKLAGPAGSEYDRYEPGVYASVMGAGIDAKNKTILIGNKSFNAVLTFSFPEIF